MPLALDRFLRLASPVRARESRPLVTALCLLLSTCTFSALSAADAPKPIALPQAHAHNDYEHPRPLLDALDHGFGSVEADIHLVDGQLLVAHDLHQTDPNRTLETLYLRPLRQRAQAHRGRIHPDTAEFVLLIDIKSDAAHTYHALRNLLSDYSDILTRYENQLTHTNAVTVILSGNRPRQLLRDEPIRFAAYDGRITDLDRTDPVHFIPLISDNWQLHFQWRGLGPVPDPDRHKLRLILHRAHRQGRKVRFWGAPDVQPAWKLLSDAGVDFINTDNLPGLRDFLLAR
jgi:hypothetical protein